MTAMPKDQRAGDGAKPPRRGKVLTWPGTNEPRLPANPQAERSLVASVIIDPSLFAQFTDIGSEDFSLSEAGLYWAAMHAAHNAGKSPSYEVIIDELYRTQTLREAGGQDRLGSWVGQTSSSLSAPYFAEIVRRTAKQRKAIELAGNLAIGVYATDADPWAMLGEFVMQAERLMANGPQALGNRLISAPSLLAKTLPPVSWVVPDLLPEGLALLASKSKIGKSWMALGLALAIGQGGYALGKTPVACGAVLYLALEDNERRLQSRMRMVLSSDPDAKAPTLCTFATSWSRLDQGGLHDIEQWLKARTLTGDNPRAVIVDVFAKVRPPRMKGGDLYSEDYAVMAGLKELADRYHVAILIIHHTRKAAAEDVFDEVRDTVAFAADTLMVLQRSRGEAEGVLHITGRDVGETKLALRFESTFGSWTLLGEAQDVARSAKRELVLRFLRSCEGNRAGIKDLAAALDMKYVNAKMLLAKMVADGELARVDDGVYRCADL